MEQISSLKKRIKTVSKIKQMTRAMQLISAIKSRKSRELLDRAFPFMVACAETMAVLMKQSDLTDNPLMKNRRKAGDKRWNLGFFVFSGDQGMAGAYNLNVLTTAEQFIHSTVLERSLEGKAVDSVAYLIGTIGAEHMMHQGVEVIEENFPISPVTYPRAGKLSHLIQEKFLAEELDEVYFIYTRLNKSLSMEVMKTRVLPADYSALHDIYEGYTTLTWEEVDENQRISYEPDPQQVLNYLMDTYLNGLTYGAMVEAYASEQTARMTAMDSATKNADEMLDTLQLRSNQARQTLITTELSEIVGGAEALKH